MTKIGRNQPCPCGSGKKYKHCCLPLVQTGQPVAPEMVQPTSFSLRTEVKKLQAAAEKKQKIFFEAGVFILFTDEIGDGWLLEVVDSDAVQVAQAGKALDIELKENEETIEVNWSHTYELRNRRLFLTSYMDRQCSELKDAPCQQIHAGIKRIRKRYTPEVMGMIHVDSHNEDTENAATDAQEKKGPVSPALN